MPAPTAPADTALVAAWLHGDRGAGESLSRRYYASVRRFFDLRVPHVADDLTQQVFVAVAERAMALRQGAAFKPYLFGIARNLLLGHLRKQGRHDRAIRVAEEDSTARTSLSVVAVRREEQVLLLMALSTLPVELQIIVDLYYWEGMSTAQIGEAVQANASTVSSRLARARTLLLGGVLELTRPGALRERLMLNLDALHRDLGSATLAANANPPKR